MIKRAFFLLLLLFPLSVNAKAKFEHAPHAKHAFERWLLTGIVSDEHGIHFGYAFLVNRIGEKMESLSQVIKLRTNQLVFSDKNVSEFKKDNEKINWRIGKDFIKYNPINESWVFGSKQKTGFNLRYEGINANRKDVEKIESIEGLKFYSLLSNRTNGNLVYENKALFVTSKNAWIYHQWLDSVNNKKYLRMMCRFNDDTGLDYLKVYQNDKITATNAEWIDAKGNTLPVSQFSRLKRIKPNQWELNLLTPKKKLIINTQQPIDLIAKGDTTTVEVGALAGDVKGFCVIDFSSWRNPSSSFQFMVSVSHGYSARGGVGKVQLSCLLSPRWYARKLCAPGSIS